MYARASKMESLPVVSLQTGEAVAWIRRPVVDIATLQIVAFQCDAGNHKQPLILVAGDIRQLAGDCVIVDSEEELAEPDDIVRLRALIKTSYDPLNKAVVSDIGRKLGTVEDYNINLASSRIEKLYLKQPLLRAWFGPNLIIDRTQIIDVTPQHIIIRDTTVENPVVQPDAMPEVHP